MTTPNPTHPIHLDLAALADRIVEHGTEHEAAALEFIAAAVAPDAPGAAAALIDWTAPEVLRLRAFAVAARTFRSISTAAGTFSVDAAENETMAPAA